MSLIGTMAHSVGAAGFVETKQGAQFSFANSPNSVFKVPGVISSPPGSTTSKEVFFTSQAAADIARKATQSTSATLIALNNEQPDSGTMMA